MKRYIKSSSDRPYLYIFKHGIGPGTLPKDVNVIKTKDLPNYYTAVWTDRFLTTSELKQYDIPSETRINELLGRIGYCQKNGDVVPCDEVLASSYIKSAREPKWWGSTYSCQVIDAYNRGELTYKNMEEWETEYNGGFKPSNMGTRGILDYYIKTGIDPRDEVEACNDITASDICYRDRDNNDSVVALDAGMSDEDVEKMLAEHPSYYRSTLDRFEACDDITASTNGSQSDFTVIQEIYDDFYEPDNVPPVYTQEYEVNLDEVLAKYPQVANRALKDWSDETFKAGDIITNTLFARYVEYIAQGEGESDQLYSDFKDYVAQHPELPDPCREIEVRINNPQCLPSAEEIRRRHSEEMGRYLGKKLGLGR